MASFSDIVSSAKGSAMGPVNQAKANYHGAVGNAKAGLEGRVNAAVGSASQAGVNGLMGAAMSAVTGDFSGALNRLTGIPNDMVGAALGAGQAMAGNPLQGANARKDAILNFNWFCVPPSIPGASLPWYYVEEASLPFRQIETQEVYRRGHHEKVPKSYSVQNLQLTFFMDNTMQAMAYLRAWQSLALGYDNPANTNAQGKWGRPRGANGFYRNIPIHVLSVNRMQVLTITYIDAWPTNLENLQLVSDAAGRLKAVVDFSVNDVAVTVTPARGLLDQLVDTALNGVIGLGMKGLSAVGSAIIPSSVQNFFR